MSIYEMITGISAENLRCRIESWFDWQIQIIEFPRYRDVCVDYKSPIVNVYTRTGGDNREFYCDENETLTKLEGYINDEDDEDDLTFVNWYFRIPDRSLADWRKFVKETKKAARERSQLYI